MADCTAIITGWYSGDSTQEATRRVADFKASNLGDWFQFTIQDQAGKRMLMSIPTGMFHELVETVDDAVTAGKWRLSKVVRTLQGQ